MPQTPILISFGLCHFSTLKSNTLQTNKKKVSWKVKTGLVKAVHVLR